MSKEEQQASLDDIVDAEISGMTNVEKEHLQTAAKKYDMDFTYIDKNYARLDTYNYENFDKEVFNVLLGLNDKSDSALFKAKQAIKTKNAMKVRADAVNMPKNIHSEALQEAEDAIKSLIEVLTWVAKGTYFLRYEKNKIMAMVNDLKVTQQDKIKVETEKSQLEIYLTQQKKMSDEAIDQQRKIFIETIQIKDKQIKDLLDEIKVMMSELRKISTKVEDIDAHHHGG